MKKGPTCVLFLWFYLAYWKKSVARALSLLCNPPQLVWAFIVLIWEPLCGISFIQPMVRVLSKTSCCPC